MYYYCSVLLLLLIHISNIEKFPSLNGKIPTKRQRVSDNEYNYLEYRTQGNLFIIGPVAALDGDSWIRFFMLDDVMRLRSTNVTLPPSVVTHVLDVENNEQKAKPRVSMVTRSTYLYTMLASSHLIRYRTISASI